MNPSVHEYVLQGPAGEFVDIFKPFAAVRSSEACIVLAVAGAIAVMLAVAGERRGHLARGVDRVAFVVASLLLLAVYGLTWGQADEVAINLEHSYNLLHFGRFSFAPTRMVDGTVEYAYYLLLTPFAGSVTSLVAANFGLGLLIAVGHLWILAGFLRDQKRSTQMALLLLYAAHYPIVAQLSNGFGNSLVSLAFLGAIRLHFAGRTVPALALTTALPLLRPDAILCSYALLFAMHADDPDRWTWRSLSRWGLPVAAVLIYLAGHRLAYGHWMPTPIAFKSVHPAMFGPGSAKALAVDLMVYLNQPTRMIGVLAVMAAAFFTDARTRFVRRLALPMALIFLFYVLTRRALADPSGDAFERYWLGFEQVLFLCLLLVLARTASWLDAAGRRFEHALVFGRLVPVAVVLVVARGIVWDGAREQEIRNRTDLAYAGELANRVIPAGLTISTTELNTFGLMIPDREVLDLWGYTEPAIAQSRLLNGIGVRNNPAWFLSTRPDVYFSYKQLDDSADTEEYLATFLPLSKKANMLGDMTQVLERYDVVLVRHPERMLVLLVTRSAVSTFDRSLRQQGFVPAVHRPLDLAKFLAFYDRIPLRQVTF